jgi:hypothetical protein
MLSALLNTLTVHISILVFDYLDTIKATSTCAFFFGLIQLHHSRLIVLCARQKSIADAKLHTKDLKVPRGNYVRNLKKTHFFIFFWFFDFFGFRHAGIARTLCDHHVKYRVNTILSFRRCFVSHDQCCRVTKKPFEVSLKGYLRNFLRIFFFFCRLCRTE